MHIRQITRVIKKIKLVLSPREKGNNEHLSNLKLIALQTIAKISKEDVNIASVVQVLISFLFLPI